MLFGQQIAHLGSVDDIKMVALRYAGGVSVNVKSLNIVASCRTAQVGVVRDRNRMSPTVQPFPNSDSAPQGGSPAEPHSAHRVLKSVALLLARHEIRRLRRWFEDFDRDILLPILLGEIALHNIGALQNGVARRSATRTGKALPERPADEAVARELKPCNAYSIAAATGLPRETVRRKIVRLIELGWYPSPRQRPPLHHRGRAGGVRHHAQFPRARPGAARNRRSRSPPARSGRQMIGRLLS